MHCHLRLWYFYFPFFLSDFLPQIKQGFRTVGSVVCRVERSTFQRCSVQQVVNSDNPLSGLAREYNIDQLRALSSGARSPSMLNAFRDGIVLGK
jgi:hypothetical protein